MAAHIATAARKLPAPPPTPTFVTQPVHPTKNKKTGQGRFLVLGAAHLLVGNPLWLAYFVTRVILEPLRETPASSPTLLMTKEVTGA